LVGVLLGIAILGLALLAWKNRERLAGSLRNIYSDSYSEAATWAFIVGLVLMGTMVGALGIRILLR